MITLNYRVETAASCAAFVEYCFGDVSTPFGRQRIADGRADPYPPFFVEIGNEQHGSSIQPYLARFKVQVDAMLAVPAAKGNLRFMVGTDILTDYKDDDIRPLFEFCSDKPCGYDWHIGLGNHTDVSTNLEMLHGLHALYARMDTNASQFVTIIGEENCDHWPNIGKMPGCHRVGADSENSPHLKCPAALTS